MKVTKDIFKTMFVVFVIWAIVGYLTAPVVGIALMFSSMIVVPVMVIMEHLNKPSI